LSIRILVLNERDLEHPRSGGAEVHVHEIFRRLAARGFDVTLLTSSFPGAESHCRQDGIDVRRLGGLAVYYPRVVAFVARQTRAGRFDIVVDCLNKAVFCAPLYSAAPVLAICHHLVGGNAFAQAAWPIAAVVWVIERFLPWVYRDTPFVAISESTRDDLMSRGVAGDRISIVEVGVELPARPTKPIQTRGENLVYVGRLVRYKRVDVLMRAAAQLVPRFPNLRFDIIGTGPDRPRLDRIVAEQGMGERVHFHGFVSAAQRDEIVSGARASLFASNREGFGLTVLEANALGTPVVASDAPGLRDAVRNGETGWLVAVDDVAGFADRAATLLSDEQTAQAMSAAALRWAQRFDWDRASDAVEAQIRERVR
jgi:glycosyltransferase involved in cell wall biosynthesis